MRMKTYLTHARIVLLNEAEIDLARQTLMPGLIDLHGDGDIAPGKCADLITVQHMNGLPYVTSLRVEGRLTYQSMMSNGPP
jgi:alpha-D-ribose 1-methylphosphonate 5-triphosphate diphosphatase PhnM